jgi:hypothetical protein
LRKEAALLGDGVVYTNGYLQCVPPSMSFKTGETNIERIWFQKNTNWDFRIAITERDGFQQRMLRIYCSCGYFQTRPDPAGNLYMRVQVNDFGDETYPTYDKANDSIDRYMKVLIGAQAAYLVQTNK